MIPNLRMKVFLVTFSLRNREVYQTQVNAMTSMVAESIASKQLPTGINYDKASTRPLREAS